MPVPHRRERSVDGLCRHASDGGGEDVHQLPVAVAVALQDRGPDGVGERSADALRKHDARPHCMASASQRVVQQRQPRSRVHKRGPLAACQRSAQKANQVASTRPGTKACTAGDMTGHVVGGEATSQRVGWLCRLARGSVYRHSGHVRCW
jgi:hypothetical protein